MCQHLIRGLFLLLRRLLQRRIVFVPCRKRLTSMSAYRDCFIWLQDCSIRTSLGVFQPSLDHDLFPWLGCFHGSDATRSTDLSRGGSAKQISCDVSSSASATLPKYTAYVQSSRSDTAGIDDQPSEISSVDIVTAVVCHGRRRRNSWGGSAIRSCIVSREFTCR